MGSSLRKSAAWLHTWCGLIVGWLLFFVFVTGTAGYFQYEITRWMQPEQVAVQPQPHALEDLRRMTSLGLARLEHMAPEASSWRITLPNSSAGGRSWQEFGVRWQQVPEPGHDFGASVTEKLDPVAGSVRAAELEPRTTAGGYGLYRMHYVLHYMPNGWGLRIVGVCTMLMLIAIVTGVITHKKIFADFFTFRPGKGQRSWLDAHNAISVMALPFFLMITYSGLVFFLFTYMPVGREVLYGSGPAARELFYDELFENEGHKHVAITRPAADVPALVTQAWAAWGEAQVASITIERHEGEPTEIAIARTNGGSLDLWNPPTLRFDATTGQALSEEPRKGGEASRTQNVMLNLHEGLFAGIWGRWLYFFAGLLGCAMIGTGLVLWTVKRRKYHLAAGHEGGEHVGVRLVENLNVATIAGLPLSVAAYFWANRLLPVEMADRAAWELHTLFAVWLGTLFYALSRPLARAWVELLWGCSLVYALVPVLNALTTHRHLGHSLLARDWVFAGFDLTMLALAVLFAVMAVKVRRRVIPGHASALHMPRAALGRGSV